jgi:SAM-dependent methyltransferase
MEMSQAKEFWKSNASHDHVRPNKDIGLGAILNYIGEGSMVLDFGCGFGALAEFFPDTLYQGVDINAERVAYCKEKYPNHSFKLIEGSYELWAGFDVVVVNNVLHHVDDSEIQGMLADFYYAAPRLVIGTHVTEGGKFKRNGVLTNWNRALKEYQGLLKRAGYPYFEETKEYNPRYGVDFHIIHAY